MASARTAFSTRKGERARDGWLRVRRDVVNWAPMTTNAPRVLAAPAAAQALADSLGGRGTKTVPDMTIADAAAKSGLPLWDAERGLHALSSEYHGHLRVAEDGELLFRFPHGLTKPWETRTRLQAIAGAIGRGLLGVARFVVRAWVAVVLIGYVLLFVAILIGLMFARSDDRGRGGGWGVGVAGAFFRVIADALFWMFHPFSPFAVTSYGRSSWGEDGRSSWGEGARFQAAPAEPKTPFYERVNRFFFGPDTPPEDPRAMEKKILVEIRAQKGRIGLADVMRVTGLPRDEADPLMARLMLAYEGSVEVSEEGGVVYRFKEIRKTAADPGVASEPRPRAVWAEAATLPPLTGNGAGTNLLIVLLNGFNLFASWWALSNHMTFSRLSQIFAGIPWEKLPPAGTAWALGVVPFVFSIALFALPLLRAAWRPIKARRVARENGRKALLRKVLEGTGRRGGVSEAELVDAWATAAGSEPSSKEITREVVALGGDVDMQRVEEGVRYRFPELDLEAKAVQAEREAAAEEEARVGKVIFSSES